jgi:hypothetical protein
MRRWRSVADDLAGGERAARMVERRHLSVVHGVGGNLLGSFDLDPEGGAWLLTALDRQIRARWAEAGRPAGRDVARQRADALVEICRRAVAEDSGTGEIDDEPVPAGTDGTAGDHVDGDAHHAPPARLAPVGVDVIVDLGTLAADPPADPARLRCDIAGYGPVPPATARRLACDGRLGLLWQAGGRPVAVGRRRRFPTPSQRRAVVARDHGCVIHGCRLPAHWCDIHHLRPWEEGGHSDPDNLVLLCRRHHLALHEGRHGLRAHTDGTWSLGSRTPPARAGPR